MRAPDPASAVDPQRRAASCRFQSKGHRQEATHSALGSGQGHSPASTRRRSTEARRLSCAAVVGGSCSARARHFRAATNAGRAFTKSTITALVGAGGSAPFMGSNVRQAAAPVSRTITRNIRSPQP